MTRREAEFHAARTAAIRDRATTGARLIEAHEALRRAETDEDRDAKTALLDAAKIGYWNACLVEAAFGTTFPTLEVV